MKSAFDRGKTSAISVWLLCVGLFCLPGSGTAQDDATALLQRGIERLDNFKEGFRRTGNRSSQQWVLEQAESELAASYEAFRRRGDTASAALSALKLGDVFRMQNAWPQAQTWYSEAAELAGQANQTAQQTQALIGRARVTMSGTHDYSAPLEDRRDFSDALDYKGQMQISQGELIAAADTYNRVFAVVKQLDDSLRLFFAYMGRAELYQKLAAKCDYALWLYYHRLDKNILCKALINYVEPKIRKQLREKGIIHSR